MRRSACFILFVALAICVLPSNAQSGASTIEAYFTGKDGAEDVCGRESNEQK